MKSNLDIEVRTTMEVDGVHLFVNEELVLLIDNDPEDLVMRTPSDGSLGTSRTMFSVDDAVEEIFGANPTQRHLGLVTIISLCIFSAFEEQNKFVNRISQ